MLWTSSRKIRYALEDLCVFTHIRDGNENEKKSGREEGRRRERVIHRWPPRFQIFFFDKQVWGKKWWCIANMGWVDTNWIGDTWRNLKFYKIAKISGFKMAIHDTVQLPIYLSNDRTYNISRIVCAQKVLDLLNVKLAYRGRRSYIDTWFNTWTEFSYWLLSASLQANEGKNNGGDILHSRSHSHPQNKINLPSISIPLPDQPVSQLIHPIFTLGVFWSKTPKPAPAPHKQVHAIKTRSLKCKVPDVSNAGQRGSTHREPATLSRVGFHPFFGWARRCNYIALHCVASRCIAAERFFLEYFGVGG